MKSDDEAVEVCSESASEAMGAYLVDAIDAADDYIGPVPPDSKLAVAYMQGAAAIHAAEITAAALDRLAVQLALLVSAASSSGRVRK